MSNPIKQLNHEGQSVWYDNIRKGLIDSGELKHLIEQGVSGVTSNPTIFEKAINGSSDYDHQIEAAVKKSLSTEQIYDELTRDDIARGADLLREVYDNTKALDGYISIEVPPTMAADTDATIAEARRLFKELNRPNIMIKVPATDEGIPAIKTLISEGINVNVTLIFSLQSYARVMDAYIEGLEIRHKKRLPLHNVASVASFFVSRVDSLVDRLIDERSIDQTLKGKAAIANAKLAYRLFEHRFNKNPQFASLRSAGAQVQRPLWASTSTKSPSYPDLMYVEALVGPDTVDTMPPATVDAVLDHGKISRTVDSSIEKSQEAITSLESSGISMDAVTTQLQQEGVKSFQQSFVSLFEGLNAKRAKIELNQKS